MIGFTPPADDREIWYVNRMLVILRPRQPFVVWANRLREEDEPEITLDELREDPTSFLIPQFEFMEDAVGWVRENYDLLFETQLWQWTTERHLWPVDRSWEVFQEWFDVELLASPWDVVAGPIHSDPPPSDGRWN